MGKDPVRLLMEARQDLTTIVRDSQIVVPELNKLITEWSSLGQAAQRVKGPEDVNRLHGHVKHVSKSHTISSAQLMNTVEDIKRHAKDLKNALKDYRNAVNK